MSAENLKEKTANGLLWGGISNGAQQALNLLFGIFLARLLSPADYGMVGMLTIFSLIATSLQESGFISGLNQKRDVGSADYNAVFWFNVLCSLAVYALLFFGAPLIAVWYKQPVLVPLSRLSFLSFVIASFGTAPRAWLFRNMRVKQTAIITMVSLTVSGVTGVVLAWNGFAYWGIAVQTLVYCFFVTAGSWVCAGWHPSFCIDLRPLRGMLAFSTKLLATNIFTTVNNNIFSLFFGRFYGERTVGFYNQANKWTSMGYTILTGMIWSVAQPLFARLKDDAPERLEAVFRKMMRFACFVSFPALFGLGIIAPEFITIAITDKWLPCARLMQLLCISGAFMPVSSLYSNFLISQGRSNVFMWNTVAQCLVQMALMVGLYRFGVTVMVGAYVVVNIVWLLSWHWCMQKTLRLSLVKVLCDVLPFAFLAALAMAAACGAAYAVGGNVVVSLAVKVVVAAVVYVVLMRLFGAAILKECLAFAKAKVSRR